ncbi:MAG: hypothetical protein IT364_26690 [Candidatus Hydrogenedentes bacterium]|nr:hypothetical protein [Candidatus Hydrogenedentota bacterium]
MLPASRPAKWWLLLVIVIVLAGTLFFLRHEFIEGLRGPRLYALRAFVVAASLLAWFTTQSLLGTRALTSGAITDGMHELTAPLHRYLQARPKLVNVILIVSSAFIDIFGLFLIAAGIFGPSLRPFVALLLLFAMRQVCQAFCALQAPEGMIWRHPGVPSLLVTYTVESDFFFSGHTAIAVVAAVEIAHVAPWWLGVAAGIIAFLEASVVLVLRAHYTMDIFAAVAAAFCAIGLAGWICPVA